MTIYALADSLLDAEHRRNAVARDLAELSRRALAALEELRVADAEVARIRERLADQVGCNG